jgi:predicted transposase/invertase (TIGR01784 family)
MEQVTNPHDKFFKETLSREEMARDFVLHYLPERIRDCLDVDSLTVSKDTFVDKELREYFSDLLYSIDVKAGGSAYVYLLFEHKSFSDPLTGLHVLRYMVRIWEQCLKRGEGRPLPAIIPMVVYHGKGRWKVGLAFHDLFDMPDVLGRLVPNFDYLLCDLTRYSDEEIKGAVFVRVCLLLLKHIFLDDLPEKLPGILGFLKGFSDQRSGLEYLETVLRYVASGTDQIKREEMIKEVKHIFEEQGGDIMATLAEQWIEEGKREGKREGMQQGMQQGMLQEAREMVYEAVSSRFGIIPEDIVREINAVEDRAVLRSLLRQAISCEDLQTFRQMLKRK